jgi:hypothetical protein
MTTDKETAVERAAEGGAFVEAFQPFRNSADASPAELAGLALLLDAIAAFAGGFSTPREALGALMRAIRATGFAQNGESWRAQSCRQTLRRLLDRSDVGRHHLMSVVGATEDDIQAVYEDEEGTDGE